MLYGPSTAFSYKPPKQRPRRFGSPTVLACHTCQGYIVMLTAPKTGRRVAVPLETFASNPSLVYSHAKHGFPHFHDAEKRARRPRIPHD